MGNAHSNMQQKFDNIMVTNSLPLSYIITGWFKQEYYEFYKTGPQWHSAKGVLMELQMFTFRNSNNAFLNKQQQLQELLPIPKNSNAGSWVCKIQMTMLQFMKTQCNKNIISIKKIY